MNQPVVERRLLIQKENNLKIDHRIFLEVRKYGKISAAIEVFQSNFNSQHQKFNDAKYSYENIKDKLYGIFSLHVTASPITFSVQGMHCLVNYMYRLSMLFSHGQS